MAVEGKRGKKKKKKKRKTTRRLKTSLFHCLSAVKSDEFTGVNAEGVRVALLAARPDLIVVLNPQNPQSKSFEVMLGRKGSTRYVWSGIKKDPPRKLKFPEPEVLALEKALKTE
uniref:Uncharacterized protein n=1 Tax=Oncorhynchus mykiss TaxID=8022 RepID=A0A8C7TNQ0_ONCMY